MYLIMLKIRRFEEKLVSLYPEQEIKCPVHLYIGQEAIATGVCANLKKDDYVFSTHRCHGHYIAKGGDLNLMMAELYGRKTGCSAGKGGSMHLTDPDHGFLGATAIVGGNIPLAVGAALASVIQRKHRVSVAFFGDGAADEGAFHESLSFASLHKLPVVFVCENNFYATNSPQSARQPKDNIYLRGGIYGVPGVRLDGNDVTAVFRVAGQAVKRAREGKGPTLLECRTYRWKRHVGPEDDCGEDGCRPKEEFDRWLRKCPIKRYENFLLKRNIFTKFGLTRAAGQIDREIETAVSFGKESPFPAEDELYQDLHKG